MEFDANASVPAVAPSRPPSAVADPLRAVACPRCEYDLAGLPAAGVCPECGRAYGPHETVLYGKDLLVDSLGWRRVAAVAVTWAFASAAGWVVTATGRYPRFDVHPAAATAFGTAASGVVWAVVWVGGRIARSRRGPRLQVRFTPAGVRRRLRSAFGATGHQLAEGWAVPWSWVRSVEVTSLPGDRLRVRVAVPRQRWLPQWDAVDVVVGCPPSCVRALHDRIKSWRATAAHTEVSR